MTSPVSLGGDVEMRTFFQLIKRALPYALLAALASAAAVFAASQRMPESFVATATLNLPRTSPRALEPGALTFVAPPADSQAYLVAAQSLDVLTGALSRMGVDPISNETILDFMESVSVDSVRGDDSSLISISVEAPTAAGAAQAANAVASVLVDWDRSRAAAVLEEAIAASEAGMLAAPSESVAAELASRHANLVSLRGAAVSAIQLVTPAEPPLEASAPRPVRYAAIAFIAVLFAALAVALLRPAFAGRYRDEMEAAADLRLPLIGKFTSAKSPKVRAEAIRSAASYAASFVSGAARDQGLGTVFAVASPRPSEAARDFSLGLAVAFADFGKKTLFIDTDLRSPISIDPLVDRGKSTPPLGVALRDRVSAPRPSIVKKGVTHLHVIPANDEADDSTALLAEGLPRVLRTMADKYEAIVLNTTPLLVAADALGFLDECDGVVMVVDADVVTKEDTLKAIELVGQSGGRLLGFLYASRTVKWIRQRSPQAKRSGATPLALDLVLQKQN